MYIGPFSTVPLEEAGFHCPRLRIPLRNPLKIAEFTQEVVKDGAKNLLDYGVLRSPIDTSRGSVNIVEGQLIKVQNANLSFVEAFQASLFKNLLHILSAYVMKRL